MGKSVLWRPKLHFSPKKGWMNDPNGLIYTNGIYHMFFQHNPGDVVWGNLHWGHAISRDLMTWQEVSEALYPDEDGDIYSGSCVQNKNTERIYAFYTCHRNETEDCQKLERQYMAFSDDGMVFEKYRNNPVIPGIDGKNQRDPFVFDNPVRGGHSMCLTDEGSVAFYHSDNLTKWEKTGVFIPDGSSLQGECECPCLFSVKTEEGMKWVLMVSMILSDGEMEKTPSVYNKSRNVMQYFTGRFDGDAFVADDSSDEPLLVNYGPDYYAGTVFYGTERPVSIAWLGEFEYANDIPTGVEGFRGAMSLPRILSLKRTDKGYRLCQEICGKEYFEKSENRGVFARNVKITAGQKIRIGNDDEYIMIKVYEDHLMVDRSRAGVSDFSAPYKEERLMRFEVPRMTNDDTIQIIWDRCILELLLDGGITAVTMYAFPEKDFEYIQCK